MAPSIYRVCFDYSPTWPACPTAPVWPSLGGLCLISQGVFVLARVCTALCVCALLFTLGASGLPSRNVSPPV